MHLPLPNSNESKTIHVIGRYPPPIDGQSLATQNLADLLQNDYAVKRFNMALADRVLLPSGLSGMRSTMSHYLGLKPKLKEQISDGCPVLWTSISAQSSGHWRDLLAILPSFKPTQAIVAVVHWGTFSKIFTHWRTASTARHLTRRLNRIVVLSQELANQVAEWIPEEKLTVIPNYVEALASKDQLATKRLQYSSSKALKVLFLGHMIREKGCYDLLRGIAIAVKKGVAVEAHFAGRWNNDSDEGHFYHELRGLGLAQYVTVHGPIDDRETVAELHRTAHVFALPSVLAHEAQPLAIMEALSAATPVITTKRPIFEALAGPEHGAFLVPSNNPEAIADGLQSLSNEHLWMKNSLAARKHYESAYSPESVRELWINLIQSL
ncbi:MAG: glycosyltransferase family 4 protein [Bacteroidetes bacterium]|nr:glycosyltransferase family 4 protein [Bacteroidota bacterium]